MVYEAFIDDSKDRHAEKVVVTRNKHKTSIDPELLEFLWNNVDGDRLPDGGSEAQRDRFTGPNTFIRNGIFRVDESDRYEGIAYQAVVTLGRLVPKKK